MKRITKIMSLVLVLSVLIGAFCSSTAFAMSNDCTTIDGYVGNIGICGGSDVIEKGDTLGLSIRSSKMTDNVSGLNVVWSVEDTSLATLTDLGYNKEFNSFKATIKFLKAGVTVKVHATVNGIQLDREFTVEAAPEKATAVILSNNAVNISGKGKTARVNISFTPKDARLIAGDVNPSVTSGNPHIATAIFSHTVTGDIYFTVTGVANGTTSIYVKTASGPSAKCLVTVTGAGTPATVTTVKKNVTSKTVSAASTATTPKKTVVGSAASASPVASSVNSPASVASNTLSTKSTESTLSTGSAASSEDAASSAVQVPQVTDSELTSSETSSVSAASVISSNFNGSDNSKNVGTYIAIIAAVLACAGIVAYLIVRKRGTKSSKK